MTDNVKTRNNKYEISRIWMLTRQQLCSKWVSLIRRTSRETQLYEFSCELAVHQKDETAHKKHII